MGYIFGSYDGTKYVNAKYDDTIWFTTECNYFNEWYFVVEDILSDDDSRYLLVEFSKWDEEGRKEAYEKAARFYNSLVPKKWQVALEEAE